jgi:hypothetical protein
MLESLDRLYTWASRGPTPGFPEEDAAEQAVVESQEKLGGAQRRLSCEQQALQVPGQAERVMAALLKSGVLATLSQTWRSIRRWRGHRPMSINCSC